LNEKNKTRQGSVNLSCGGIASFCKFPICPNLDDLKSDVAILGIPWDSGTGYRPGSRLGPRSVRNYSVRFAFGERGVKKSGYWDITEKRRYLENISFSDCGDVDVLYLDVEESFKRITKDVSKILKKKAFPVIIGGDHSVTFPVVRGYKGFEEDINLIHFDAHPDYNDSVLGVRFASGSPIKRCSELNYIKKILSIGVRGLRNNEVAYQDAISRGNMFVSAEDVLFKKETDFISKIPKGNVYVTIDMDVFDPSIAPGVCSPEAGGLLYYHVKSLLKAIAIKCRVVGMDLVEVNPMVENIGVTSSLAAQIILEFLGAIFNEKYRRW